MLNKQSAIAVFDSGVGGLTVLAELRKALPHEHFIYLGDTARVPYGIKSAEVVQRYALEAVQYLQSHFTLKAFVIACNSVSAVALKILEEHYPKLPFFSVIEPGVASLLAATQRGPVAVLATEATIQSHAYVAALQQQQPTLRVTSIACPLFVPLAEENLTHGPIVEATIAHYLTPLKNTPYDAVLLGCTHYPLLKSAIEHFLGPTTAVIDSAKPMAQKVATCVTPAKENTAPTLTILTTDDPKRFIRVGTRFLGEPLITPTQVNLSV